MGTHRPMACVFDALWIRWESFGENRYRVSTPLLDLDRSA